MSSSPVTSPFELVEIDLDDETSISLVDAFCSSLSDSAREAYQEALDRRIADGCDPIGARQFALFQAALQESILRALESSLSGAPLPEPPFPKASF